MGVLGHDFATASRFRNTSILIFTLDTRRQRNYNITDLLSASPPNITDTLISRLNSACHFEFRGRFNGISMKRASSVGTPQGATAPGMPLEYRHFLVYYPAVTSMRTSLNTGGHIQSVFEPVTSQVIKDAMRGKAEQYLSSRRPLVT